MKLDREEFAEYRERVKPHYMKLMTEAAAHKPETEIEPEFYEIAGELLFLGFQENKRPDLVALEIIRALGLLPTPKNMQ